MVNYESINAYQNPDVIYRGDNSIVVTPHKLLRPYIANYTFTNPRAMPQQQMILPTVSNTLVYSVSDNKITNGLRGVNTKPVAIGSFARQFNFMFLIEFHAAGLYPFIAVDQNLLLDNVCSFEDLSKEINQQIIEAYFMADNISALKHRLDEIFLSKLNNCAVNQTLRYAMQRVLENKGAIPIKVLAGDVYYSEKQLNRLFQKHIGTGMKTFSRIVRMKYAVDLLNSPIDLSELTEMTGHYDVSHFSHDFKNIYGLAPGDYIEKMSLFYNDPFKLDGYNGID